MRLRTKKKTSTIPNQEEIDQVIISESEKSPAWEPPVRVKRSRPTSLPIPGELAARAEFLAKLHREPNVAKWVERVVWERVELEEVAFTEARRQLAS
jgi:hypothetical protein